MNRASLAASALGVGPVSKPTWAFLRSAFSPPRPRSSSAKRTRAGRPAVSPASGRACVALNTASASTGGVSAPARSAVPRTSPPASVTTTSQMGTNRPSISVTSDSRADSSHVSSVFGSRRTSVGVGGGRSDRRAASAIRSANAGHGTVAPGPIRWTAAATSSPSSRKPLAPNGGAPASSDRSNRSSRSAKWHCAPSLHPSSYVSGGSPSPATSSSPSTIRMRLPRERAAVHGDVDPDEPGGRGGFHVQAGRGGFCAVTSRPVPVSLSRRRSSAFSASPTGPAPT